MNKRKKYNWVEFSNGRETIKKMTMCEALGIPVSLKEENELIEYIANEIKRECLLAGDRPGDMEYLV